MRHRQFGRLPELERLSIIVVSELIRRAFNDGHLSEIEQLIFGFRHQILPEETEPEYSSLANARSSDNLIGDEENLVKIEMVARLVYEYTGQRLSSGKVLSILDQAESKVNDYSWKILDMSARHFLRIADTD